MVISESEFKDLCKLARLDPEDESLKNLMSDFNRILESVNQINEIDVKDDAAGHSELDTRDMTRPDEPVEPLGTEAISEIAPDFQSGHFVVPGVIESEG
ncbi:MAG TPA: Asp-tRNA(Asn)/Glu-tRNA(Gln) amidotransferase GatCAB subunit C [Leptospiraceae bacterium]|nr:Asp-tRNA(Asn)/Glu-tRNA(Gln) amidotransferase GatCAB subunit C [Spirochaetaceae bacterium]HBS04918.1 Asp-tRNA(Asn)/Glu-tRNA(Gln) amidotransferase GatCAB subunit C [Leptospiraceae bacterium]|tara:strand:- start:12084 stop:12380 length:297 start_codon:yes stop_codon:yes gene_type:complete